MLHLVDDTLEKELVTTYLIKPAKNRTAHPWATRGFFKICWPNLSVLKIGFLVPDDEGSKLSFVCFFPDFLAADFTEGSCPREKRSEVALGMAGVDGAERGRK